MQVFFYDIVRLLSLMCYHSFYVVAGEDREDGVWCHELNDAFLCHILYLQRYLSEKKSIKNLEVKHPSSEIQIPIS